MGFEIRCSIYGYETLEIVKHCFKSCWVPNHVWLTFDNNLEVVERVDLIRDTYWIDFILGDLAYDEDHPTSKEFLNHPTRYPFSF